MEVPELDRIYKTVPRELRTCVDELVSLKNKKLWHSLSLRLLEFYRNREAFPYLLEMFVCFIKDLEGKISEFNFVELASIAAGTIGDPAEAFEFLKGLEPKVKGDDVAHAYILTETAYYRVDDVEYAKDALKKSKSLLEGTHGIDSKINASQYRLASQIDKITLDYSNYYRNAMAYLRVVELSEREQKEWIVSVAVSAILGLDIYDFGELIHSNYIMVLENTESEWIKKLVESMNKGDLMKFEEIVSQNMNQGFIESNVVFIRQKQRLMVLTNLLFEKDPKEHSVPLEKITNHTKLSLEESESLIMKAMSLGLVSGKIDYIERVFICTKVQPRILNTEQIYDLGNRLDKWHNLVDSFTSSLFKETAKWAKN